MQQGQIKNKLHAISVPGVKALVTDIVTLCYRDIDNEGSEGEPSERAFGEYAARLLNKLKSQYEKQIKKQEQVKHIDLEDMIKTCKEEQANKK